MPTNIGVRGLPERRIFSWARWEVGRLRISRFRRDPARPNPTRPDPARPGISAGHIPPLKMTDLVPSVVVVVVVLDLRERASQSSVWAGNNGHLHYIGTRNPFLMLPRAPGALLGPFWPCKFLVDRKTIQKSTPDDFNTIPGQNFSRRIRW